MTEKMCGLNPMDKFQEIWSKSNLVSDLLLKYLQIITDCCLDHYFATKQELNALPKDKDVQTPTTTPSDNNNTTTSDAKWVEVKHYIAYTAILSLQCTAFHFIVAFHSNIWISFHTLHCMYCNSIITLHYSFYYWISFIHHFEVISYIKLHYF
jgi:hypothetical protein